MNRWLILLILSVVISSCIVNMDLPGMEGEYSTEGKNIKHYLELKNDSTFVYSIGFRGSLLSQCTGRWSLTKNRDSVEIFCIDQELLEPLTSTYLEKRNNKFKIKSLKLKNGEMVLNKNEN